ncbi:hypothetical protein Calag_0236 [Caldisphaera lagunensis DSM 15908]|uniref:Uncharacterized protein n=1 Tax=Caldisphaera lagunensis (strain DSM 15908 / JCM 11604 / ANMR 0165 / IC-154) TaxID=1056495 RepID=L0A822_CALLD|nr:hypothetical protein [Caldisphaera lagunensis]AFZ70018.1 hypothetical protein Calag_0236 [Caldisphaera lagunensis DSM 15908]
MNNTIEDCTSILKRLYLKSRIINEIIQFFDVEPSLNPPNGLSLVLKSLHEPSIDEIPIYNTIVGSFNFNEIYEYERVAEIPKGDRINNLSLFIMDSYQKNRGIVAIIPSLLVIGLTSKLPENIINDLENSLLAEIEVSSENILYLPDRSYLPGNSIEIVAKSNSESSYERVEWLKNEAEKEGIKVENVKFLPDNKSIMDYIASGGIKGYLKRVPVTKIATMIVAASQCLNLEGVNDIVRREQSKHTIYTIGLTNEMLNELKESLIKNKIEGAPLLRISSNIEPFFNKGLIESMSEFLRRFGYLT